jgi:hypothetical protein
MSNTTTDLSRYINRYDVAHKVANKKPGDNGADYLPPETREIEIAGETWIANYPHVYIERRGHSDEDIWVISYMGCCLGPDGEWEWEPQPSSRSDEFLERHRFTLDEAFGLCREHGIITE